MSSHKKDIDHDMDTNSVIDDTDTDSVIDDTDTDSVINDTDTDSIIDTDSVIDDTELQLNDISDNEYKVSLISLEDFNTFYKEYSKNNKTSNILNKYEKTKILSERAEQLSEDAVPLIPNAHKYNNVLEIAEEELRQLKIPFIIKREINNTYEYIKIEDLIIL